jgi:hypothetical protein
VKTALGTKVTISMPDGLLWPAIALGDETSTEVEIVDRRTNEKVKITVTRNDFVSLRTSKAGEKYARLSNEVVMYGYRVVTNPRVSPVVGLDVDADGVLIPLQQHLDNIAASDAISRAKAFEARHGATAAEDL